MIGQPCILSQYKGMIFTLYDWTDSLKLGLVFSIKKGRSTVVPTKVQKISPKQYYWDIL